jgi:hypothetical protein
MARIKENIIMKSLLKTNFRLLVAIMSLLPMTLLTSCKVTSKESNTSLASLSPEDNATLSEPTEQLPVEEKIEGFSEVCYLERYPEVKQMWVTEDGKSAVSHYLQNGQFENRIPGCDPSPVQNFNDACYLEKNPDVAEIWVNNEKRIPVEHYILYGRNENREISCSAENL